MQALTRTGMEDDLRQIFARLVHDADVDGLITSAQRSIGTKTL